MDLKLVTCAACERQYYDEDSDLDLCPTCYDVACEGWADEYDTACDERSYGPDHCPTCGNDAPCDCTATGK